MHEPTPETDALLRRVRAFVHEELFPLEERFRTEPFRALLPALAEKRGRVKELGLWAPHLPRELGGLGLPLAEFGRVSEELGRSPLGHLAFNCQAPDVGTMELLHAHGTEEQRRRFLEPLVRGEVRSCFAMTEPEHAGSNPVHLGTRAVRDGGDYVIDGHKWFTSAADGAAFAIVMAVTNPAAEKPHALASQFLVPAGTPGFRIVRNIPVMGEAGEDYFSHAEVVFEGCRVPVENRLGAEGSGFLLAQERLGPGRIHHCMRWIGICERAFEMMCRRAADRELSPGQPLASRQAVQHWIAESRAEIDAARLMTLDTAERIDRGGARAARVQVSTIKFFVAGVLQRGCWTGPSRPTGRWGSRTTCCCPSGTGTSGGRASTTGPTRCTSRWWRGRSCGSTEFLELLVRACPRLAPGSGCGSVAHELPCATESSPGGNCPAGSRPFGPKSLTQLQSVHRTESGGALGGSRSHRRPAAVRAGEELDTAALEAYLRAALPEAAGPVQVEQFPRGFSNLTYLVRAGGREMVLRRPPHGADVRGGHDVEREFRVLSGLRPVYPKVPRPLAFCADRAVLGAPFYLMERVPGVILRSRPPEGLEPAPERMRSVCLALVDTLVELHAIDPATAGLADLGRPEGYAARQVEGWTGRYLRAKTDEIPELEEAAAWLARSVPAEGGAALIHNDYKYDNLVLDPADPSRVRAVLDWEMATVGDPLMDLGTTLGYWAEAGDPPELRQFGVTWLPGNLDRRGVAEAYAERSGRDVSGILFHYVYGLFKVAVIAQQIYARHLAGHTRDPRFGGLVHVVRACGRMAAAALERGRIHDLA